MTLLNRIGGLAASMLLAGCAAFGTGPQSEVNLDIGVFQGPGAWPLIVAQREGFFAEQGLAVRIVSVSDAREMYAGVAGGKLDGVVTAFDNLLARDAPGSVGTLDLKAISSYVEGGLAVVGGDLAPNQPIRFGVDHPDSGFALYGRDWLARAGATSAVLVETGGTAERFEALQAGLIDATVLHPPFVEAAQATGFKVLESLDARGVRYQTGVLAVRERWSERTGAASRVVTAYCNASRWLADPANREEAIAVLIEAAPDMPRPAVERSYGALARSFSRDGVLGREAIETVRAMRAARAGSAPPPAEEVVDFHAAQQARCAS